MNVIEKFQHFATCIEIVHHLPGRVRLRLALDELAALGTPMQALLDQASAFKKALSAVPGVRSVRVNALARSCTVEYDAGCIPPQAWVDFLGGVRSAAADALRQTINEKYAELVCG